MKRVLKIVMFTVLGLVFVVSAVTAIFIYKVNYGFPVSYETNAPDIQFRKGKKSVLLFSKATGFVHTESIEAGKLAFSDMADRNDWFLYSTDEGGVFNTEQLSAFDVVIFNNSTGRVLNDEQQLALQNYVENGGMLLGIHGAGDNSHHWNWYVKNLTGAEFSHHPLNPQIQKAVVILNAIPDSTISAGLATFTVEDEWYIFYSSPRAFGFHILYNIDGENIRADANIPLLASGKNFGMGKDHPVAWYKATGKGRTFYTSMGHNINAWQQPHFVTMLENAIRAWPPMQ